MSNLLTLSTDGLIKDKEEILAKRHQYYINSDKLQSSLYYGNIKNLNEIIGNNNSDIERMINNIQEDYKDYLVRFSEYKRVIVEITYDEKTKTVSFNASIDLTTGEIINLSNVTKYIGE